MKTFLKCLISITNFIICTIIYLIEVALLIILSIDSILSYRTINALLQNIEVKEIINNIDTDKNILQNIYDGAKEIGISKESIDNLLESKEIKNLLAEYISAGAGYILRGEDNINIKVQTIVNNAVDNFNKILKDNDEYLNQSQKEDLEKVVQNITTKLKENLPEVSELTKDFDLTTLKYIRTIFSIKTILTLIFSILLLTSIIALLKRSYFTWTINLSITTLFASLIGIVVALVPLFDFTNIIPGLPIYILDLIKSGAQIICNNFFIIGIIYFIIGISLAALYRSYRRKKEILIN